MEKESQYFVYLISCFLNNKTPAFQTVAWNEIYRLSVIHNITAVIAQEIMLIPDENKPDAEIYSNFRQQLGYTIQNYEIKQNIIFDVKKILNESSINHIFVKGAVIKDLYPVPEFRTSGDIDVIVEKENFDSVKKILCKNTGYNLISENADTLIFENGDINIEIHNNADVDSDYFENIFSLCTKKDGCTYILDDITHLLYIVCHMSKHLNYRGAGIRMLMDIDVAVRNIKNFNQDDFIALCNRAGRQKSAQVLLSLAAFWFDTPINPYFNFNNELKLLENLEKIIIEGGSFGYKINSVPVSYVKDIEYKNGKMPLLSKIKIILKMAFPGSEYLQKCYPYAKKHKWLYPVACLNRLWDGLFKKREHTKNVISQISSGSDVSKIQQELLQELNIID